MLARQQFAPVRLAAMLLAAAACVAPLRAVDVKSLKPEGYLSDFAHVVSAGEKAHIEDYCGRVERATGVQMALVTLPTLEGAPIEDFANDLFHSWGVGKRQENNGVLLLLVINDRKSRIEVGYGLEPDLPDGFAGGTLREMRPALRARQYGTAMLTGAQAMGQRIAEAKKVSLDAAAPAPVVQEPGEERRGSGGSLVSKIVGLLIILLLIRLFAGRGGFGGFLTGLFLGNLFGRGGRGDGGGGWGGGGFGGGGFGGFGGGDSGGGGASSDW